MNRPEVGNDDGGFESSGRRSSESESSLRTSPLLPVPNVDIGDDDAVEVEEVENSSQLMVIGGGAKEFRGESRNHERERTRRKRRTIVGVELVGSHAVDGTSDLEDGDGGMGVDEGEGLVGEEGEGDFEGSEVDEDWEDRNEVLGSRHVSIDRVLGFPVDERELSGRRGEKGKSQRRVFERLKL